MRKVKLALIVSVSIATSIALQANDSYSFEEEISKISKSLESEFVKYENKKDMFEDTNDFEEGFDDEVEELVEEITSKEEEESLLISIPGLSGKITQQASYSLRKKEHHDGLTSLRSSIFLDYENKFESGLRFKVNAKTYYDSIYSIKKEEVFTKEEKDVLGSEVRLYDAYVEGQITDNLDVKFGRQVVVWGRSDTIRVTDVINPIDNRNPGMTDIEDIRIPLTMVKLDYFIGDWRITPIAILEQSFSLNPPYGSNFYPFEMNSPKEKEYKGVSPALSVGAEFNGWDINFYASRLRDDEGHINIDFEEGMTKKHNEVNMLGTAINVLSGSWLFKTEFAYKDGLKYTWTKDKDFSRTDLLLGVEYNGISDTTINYDVVTRKIGGYDESLMNPYFPIEETTYQHALRIGSSFLNSELKVDYVISMNGKSLNEGGFQRATMKYEIADGINANLGVVDYIGTKKTGEMASGAGSMSLFNEIKDNDMVFMDISYSF